MMPRQRGAPGDVAQVKLQVIESVGRHLRGCIAVNRPRKAQTVQTHFDSDLPKAAVTDETILSGIVSRAFPESSRLFSHHHKNV